MTKVTDLEANLEQFKIKQAAINSEAAKQRALLQETIEKNKVFLEARVLIRTAVSIIGFKKMEQFKIDQLEANLERFKIDQATINSEAAKQRDLLRATIEKNKVEADRQFFKISHD
ncbi:hypothetical protein Tco_0418664 [Tanacetum coccineum]